MGDRYDEKARTIYEQHVTRDDAICDRRAQHEIAVAMRTLAAEERAAGREEAAQVADGYAERCAHYAIGLCRAIASDIRAIGTSTEVKACGALSCDHATTEPGPRVPARYGTHPTHVCPRCGWWRVRNHGAWQPPHKLAIVLNRDVDGDVDG